VATAIANDVSDRFVLLAEKYRGRITDRQLSDLSAALGISVESLKRLRTGWDGTAFTFPMSEPSGKVIGVRRRFGNGRKASVKGGKAGLFIPTDLSGQGLLLIVEGESDCAAGLETLASIA